MREQEWPALQLRRDTGYPPWEDRETDRELGQSLKEMGPRMCSEGSKAKKSIKIKLVSC